MFGRHRMIPASIVEPNPISRCAKRGHERTSIRRDSDALLFTRTEGHLLWRAAGKRLTPEMEAAGRIGREVHPSSIRAPGHGHAGAHRSDGLPGRGAIKGHETAAQPYTA